MGPRDVDGRIKGLVIVLGDRLSVRDQDLVVEMVDHNEPVVGFEWLADALSEAEVALTETECAELVALAAEVGSERASRAVASCPSASG